MKGKKKELQAASKFAVDLHEECEDRKSVV